VTDAVATRRIEASWLKAKPLAQVLHLLAGDGEEARVIGGAVRNTLLGFPRSDIDIATTVMPDDIVRRVEAAGFKAVPTGIAHGTITVVAHGTPLEVTTLREDVETFGRHATVAFGRDWRQDAARRDFTMNALSVDADGTVFDYVGGLADLDQRRVRFIGDPHQRIREDYLRILRFFRFHASYGSGGPDAEGLAACISERAGLDQLSRERVRMELLKLLAAPQVVPVTTVMADAGLLVSLLGGVPLVPGLANMVAIEAAMGLPPQPIRRLGALALMVREDADRLLTKLRLANDEHEQLRAMVETWWKATPLIDDAAARVLLYRLKADSFVDRVLFAWARSGAPASDSAWRALAGLPQRWTIPVFPLKAADFISRGVERGPALGAALRRAEESWIAAGFPAAPPVLAEIADGQIK